MLTTAAGRGLYISRRVMRWMRRRFTTIGFCLLIGLAITLGTDNPDHTMGLGAFLLLMTALAAALAVAPFFRVRLTIERHAPRLVTAGDSFTLRVGVSNPGRSTECGLDYTEELREAVLSRYDLVDMVTRIWRRSRRARRELRAARCTPVHVPDLSPGAHTDLLVTVTAWRRGALTITGGLFMRTDAMGIFRAFARCPAPCTVLVLPRRYPLPAIELPGRSREQHAGTALATGIGESEEFVALRDYRRGDPLKHVHWRGVARTGRLVVKEYQDEHLMRHGLVLDTMCAPDDDARFEEAVAVAASFACTVPDQEALLDLLLIGRSAIHLTAGRGMGQVQPMLEALALVQPSRESRMTELETLVAKHRGSLSSCMLVLLDWDGPRRALVRRLRASRLPLTVLLLLPEGRTAPAEPGAPEEQPDRLILLESGRVAEGLRALGTSS